VSVEEFSPKLAAKCAQRDPPEKGVTMHHFRCDWVQGEWPETKRCRLDSMHTGDHVYE
jgi:hypothetical protein